jgi:hypothetical protein
MQRFKHPSNLRNDPKFRSVEKKLDEAGYARAVKLLEIVAEQGGKGDEFSPEFALLDNTDIAWLADEWRISEKKARTTLDVFAGVGLIDPHAWSGQIVRIPLLNECLDEYTQRQQKSRNSRATPESVRSDSRVTPVKSATKVGAAHVESPKKDKAIAAVDALRPRVEADQWQAIKVEPCGSEEFGEIWGHTWRTRPDGEVLSDTMWRCIEACEQDQVEVQVPGLFREALQGEFEKEMEPFYEERAARLADS